MRLHNWRYNAFLQEYRSDVGGLIRHCEGGFEFYQTYGIRVRDQKKIAATVTEAMDALEGLGVLERLAQIA